ncbi:unnamed protein product, partial [Polarella glacialis]
VFKLYLEKIDGSDTEALCGLVQALASSDAERATEYASRLQVPSFEHLDPEELEASPIPKIGATLAMKKREKDQENVEAAVGSENPAQAKAKRIRKRKPLYPKNFDPENPGPPPDPERWLPKRERTEFKKKMRKRDKNLLRGPQGAMVVDESALGRKQGPSTAQVEVTSDKLRAPKAQARKPKGKK